MGIKKVALIWVLAAMLAACGVEAVDPVVSSPTTGSTASSALEPVSTTVTSEETTTTAEVVETTPAELTPLNIMDPPGVFAPVSGYVVVTKPYRFTVFFPGQSVPDSVEVTGVSLPEQSDGHVYETQLDLNEGENLVSVIVRRDGATSRYEIPITYLAGAEHRLGWVTAADTARITVDYAVWDDDREFPGPQDSDPGSLEALAVARHVKVIVSSEHETSYDWFVREVNGEYANLSGLDGLDEWNPGGAYPYTITIHENTVVQLRLIPLG